MLDPVITERYALYNADCIDIMSALPDNKVKFSIYSPPCAGLYHYSSSARDLSNARNYQEFMEHYEFVVKEIHRLTMPGRLTAVHCMDVPSGNSGVDNLMDFPGDIIDMHVHCRDEKCTATPLERRKGLCGHGWFEYTGRYHVWKEPLGVRNRTMAKNLAHKTVVDDSSKCSLASADYLLLFRKHGENAEPINHPAGLMNYAGERQMPADILKYRGWKGNQIENRYSQWIWRRYADAFWDDIRIDRVLPFRDSRDGEDEKHVHPLQLDVIERAVVLWSNPGDVVLTPFMGVGSEVYQAVQLGRFGLGIELKDTYFRQSIKNLEMVDADIVHEPDMFDMLDE